MLVLLELPRQDDQLGAQLARPRSGHGSINAELARFVGSRCDNAALLPADCQRLAAQARVSRLFHGRKESVCIEMDDDAHVPLKCINIHSFRSVKAVLINRNPLGRISSLSSSASHLINTLL